VRAHTHLHTRIHAHTLPVSFAASQLMFWTHFLGLIFSLDTLSLFLCGWTKSDYCCLMKPGGKAKSRQAAAADADWCQSCREIDGAMWSLACDTWAHTSYTSHIIIIIIIIIISSGLSLLPLAPEEWRKRTGRQTKPRRTVKERQK